MAGYPFHVRVTGATTLDLGVGTPTVVKQCAGNLTIDVGSSILLNGVGHQMTAPLTVNGNVLILGSLTLSGLAGGDLTTSGNLTN